VCCDQTFGKDEARLIREQLLCQDNRELLSRDFVTKQLSSAQTPADGDWALSR